MGPKSQKHPKENIVDIYFFLLNRFFYGKNTVMQLALGRTEADEYKDNLHKISKVLIHFIILKMNQTEI